MFDFGLRLKKLRESKHLSQDDLSKRINKSKSVISGYENNVKTPPLDVLISLSLIYNVSLDYLVGIEKKEMVSIENLSKRQKNLIYNLLFEFQSPNSQASNLGLSERQQEILNVLMIEFHNK